MSPVRPIAVVVRRALAAAVCLALSLPTAPTTGADPDAEPAPPEAAPVAEESLPSNPPVVLKTPDGWTLGLGARDEQQLPVAPLTTAV